MTPELYGHPFASFVWKPLIALYERRIDFTFRMIDGDHMDNIARAAELSPTGQFPALVDGDHEVVQSNAIIEYLDLYHGDAAPMVPADAKAALGARMFADVLDDYVQEPMQKIVADSMRAADEKDPRGVADAHTKLEKTYAWLDKHLGPTWAVSDSFTIADCAAAPALFYADWVHPISADYPKLAAYRARVLAHPSVARVVDEARPFRHFFPLGAPDRD